MKIKTKKSTYKEVQTFSGFKHTVPKKPNLFFRTLLKTLSEPELKKVHFTKNEIGMEKLGKDEPCLILMNHSSFIDLKIVSSVLYPRPFQIVCTYDGFVGKEWLLKNIGCIPTFKFISDVTLVKDMSYAIKKLHSSVLMYPEASYSFDGTETPLPESLGKLMKLLKVPVVMIRTHGAFLRDPLYNNLQLRDTSVSADIKYLLSPEDLKEKSVKELNDILKDEFSYDHFKEQQENGIRIYEPFRADFLNRALYKCPHCMTEGKMTGKGTTLSCASCGVKYTLTEDGFLQNEKGETKFNHIPDWYKWEREEVKKELENGSYHLEVPVKIRVMVNTDAVYEIGDGVLTHTKEGFHLTGCDRELDYYQSPKTSYSLYSDYFWYELGDMICIGTEKMLFYCFPDESVDIAAKTRLAQEELYKLTN